MNITRVEFFRRQSKWFAIMARRAYFMSKDVRHEVWSEKARASLMLMELELAEESKAVRAAHGDDMEYQVSLVPHPNSNSLSRHD